MSVDLISELDRIREDLLAMGSEVERRLHAVVHSLSSHEHDALVSIMHNDSVIDQMEATIEHQGLRLLALTQPVASDLRNVLVAMRVCGHLEQIGDQICGVAKRTIDLYDLESERGFARQALPPSLISMAKTSHGMLRSALESVRDESIGAASSIRRAKDRLNTLQREVFVWATHKVPEDVDHTVLTIDALSIARKLESIGGLSACIAEEIVFLVDGMVARTTNDLDEPAEHRAP